MGGLDKRSCFSIGVWEQVSQIVFIGRSLVLSQCYSLLPPCEIIEMVSNIADRLPYIFANAFKENAASVSCSMTFNLCKYPHKCLTIKTIHISLTFS